MSSSRRHTVAGTLLLASSLLVAACGSSSHSIASEQSGSNQAASLVKFSECMRSRGVSGFPDPSTGGQSPNSFGIDGYNFNLPAGLSTQSPAYVSADKICGSFIGSGGGPALNPALLARARQHEVALAECMRAHGVPNFPDPVVTSDGHGIASSSGGASLNPRSPAFQQAQTYCQRR
jgi:hypothetical protein